MSKKLVKSTALVGSMTLISRIFGFTRDLLWAHAFGAVIEFDAFIVAFKVPNFMRSLFAEGSFAQAFVPLLTEYRETKDSASVQQFINHIAGDFALVLLVVSVLGMLLAPLLVILFAPGFLNDPHRFTLTQSLLRITFPYLFFISLTALCGSILNTYGRFGIPAFTPVLLNITLIVATVVLVPYFSGSLAVLAGAVTVAGLLQLLLQLPFLYHLKRLPSLRINFKDPGVKRVFKLMLGALFSVSVSQLSLFIDTLFASFLPVGSISWIYYSGRLMNFPLGVIGVAVVTVIMPQLAKAHSLKSTADFTKTLRWALQSIFLMGLPAAIGLFILAKPLLATLFGYGKFSALDVLMTAHALQAFALGLPAFMLIRILNTALYARQNIRVPVKVTSISLVINIILNMLLIRPFGHIGLILSTSLASWVSVALLIYYLRQSLKQGPQDSPIICTAQSAKVMAKILVSAVAIALWLGGVMTYIGYDWMAWGWKTRLIYLLGVVLTGKAVYFTCLALLGIRIKDFLKTT